MKTFIGVLLKNLKISADLKLYLNDTLLAELNSKSEDQTYISISDLRNELTILKELIKEEDDAEAIVYMKKNRVEIAELIKTLKIHRIKLIIL